MENSSGGLSLASTLFIIFLVLKLTGQVTWSWWWITAPLWGGIALVAGIFGLVFLAACVGGLGGLAAEWFKRRRQRKIERICKRLENDLR